MYGLEHCRSGTARFLEYRGVQDEWVSARPVAGDLALMGKLGWAWAPGDVTQSYGTPVAAPSVSIDHPDAMTLRTMRTEVIGEMTLAVPTVSDIGDDSMDRAVQAALNGQGAATGGTVLLAPIGTSFDQFRDYRARGDSFRRAAQALAARPEEGA